MLKSHQGNDVTGGGQVLRRVALDREVGEILRVLLLQVEWTIRVWCNGIAQVTNRSVIAGNVPSAPPVLERRPMVDPFKKCSRNKRRAVHRGIYGRDHQTVRRTVTIQALRKAPFETR